MTIGLLAAILSGFALALVAPGLYRVARGTTGWLLALLPLGLAVYFASNAHLVASGHPLHESYPWVPALGVNLSFRLDGLGLLFALLITGVGALILVYAGGYLAGHAQLGRLYAFLLMFMASMLGLVLTDNLLALFVFWELTSLSSYLLIGFDHERGEARAAALQALLVTGGGGLALLAGLLLLGQAGGSLELSTLLGQADTLRSHPLYVPGLLLILVGAFTKSAQFPFHFWLPGAMEAPTPVSAYLHSATMVKAGIYLLARLSPALGGTDIWVWTVTVVGGATMLVGAWLALVQSDLKRVLAYSTISALGTLTLLLGLGGTLAVKAAMAFLLGHALYKGALFLVAGALDHETGTRDADRLGGLFRAMPVTALAAGVAALSMAGVPPLFGFLSKELSYEAALHAPAAAWVTAGVVAANILLVAVAGVAGLRPFLGKAIPTPRPAHEAPPSLWLGPLALAGLSIALGVWPALGADVLVSAAGTFVLGGAVDTHLTLWHGLTPAFALSAVTLVGGVSVYAGRGLLRRAASRWDSFGRWGPAGWYELALRALSGLALGQTRLLQSGYLRYYLMIVLVTTAGLAGATLVGRGRLVEPADWSGLHFYDAGLVVLILLATVATVLARSRLAAIAALGVVGYSVALVFVLFGAPDVAMTQFLVETLTVILFVVVFCHLPESPALSRALARGRDAMLAAAVGVLMTALVLIATEVQYHAPISSYFAEHSLPDAHGRNLVNVILVDFRGLDTLGEITVLAVAGVGVYALLKLRAAKEEDKASAPTNTEVAPDRDGPARVEHERDQMAHADGADQGRGLSIADPVTREGEGS
jgi:multicomponent Na+:H+ antiporter subunit A